MSSSSDAWFIRFPDGRVIRAANTTVLRRHLDAGRIPYTSTVRRSPEEEWTQLEWTTEFADLLKKPAPPPTNGISKQASRKKKKRRVVATGTPTPSGSRLDPRLFHLVGSRGILREMLAALDNTLMPKKLTVVVYAGFALGVLGALSRMPWPDLGMFQVAITWALALFGLVVMTALSAVVTRLTFVELSELRPARLREGMQGVSGRTARLLFTLLFALGGFVLLIAGLRWATVWLVAPYDMPWPMAREVGANVLTVASLMLEFALWPLFGLALLLSPILLVENCSIFQALRTWRGLLRQHFRTVLAYEGVAVVLAALLALPFALPLLLGESLAIDEPLQMAASVTRAALWSGLLALPAAYLIVANVFIYLNVRYETGSERLAAGS